MATILQVLKKIKHLDRKIEKNQERIKKCGSYITPTEEKPIYEPLKLIQSVKDMIIEVYKLKHSLHYTNATIKIKYRDKDITIDELLLMRTIIIPKFIETYKLLRSKSLNQRYSDVVYEKGSKVVRLYDPQERDKKIDKLENELAYIDCMLDEINITQEVK